MTNKLILQESETKMQNNPDVPTSIETSQQAKINDLIERLEKYKWNLVADGPLGYELTPKRDPNCMADASYAVEVLYVGPFHSDGTFDIYRGSMSRYFYDKKEWECSVHNNLRQTFEDIGYRVVAWRYYDAIPAEIEKAIREEILRSEKELEQR